MNAVELKNKKVLVVGLGLSGVAAARFLKDHGADVRCTDSGSNSELLETQKQLQALGIPVELGKHTPEFFGDTQLVVTSPGIPGWAEPIKAARERDIPVIGEIELAWQFCRGRVIGITGSNGKSTTTTLLYEVLRAAGFPARLCGNIGFPLIEQVASGTDQDVLVTELSSFQLETISTFRPWISIILNITPNHLDRYTSMDEYRAAKLRILKNQDEKCFTIANEQIRQDILSAMPEKNHPVPVFFGRRSDSQIRITDDLISVSIEGFEKLEIDRNAVKYLKGDHNAENIAAVLGAAAILDIGVEPVRNVLAEFKGLEHRLEFVAEMNGVSYINDSKATTVDAALIALDTVGRDSILIAGGRNKGSDFSPLRDAVAKTAKAVVLIGEAAGTLSQILEPYTQIELCETMRQAVRTAANIAQRGDTVLLSPACASFDMFKNFEDRGRVFKEEVHSLKSEIETTHTSKERTP